MSMLKSLNYVIRSTNPAAKIWRDPAHRHKLRQAIANVKTLMTDEGEFLNMYGEEAGMGGYSSPILKKGKKS